MNVMALSKEAQVDITLCSICLETFTAPKYLPCLHTFCEGCLSSYTTSVFRANSDAKGINCPICRDFVSKPDDRSVDEWATEFPVNHLLVSIIDISKTTRGERICDACSRENETETSFSWCINCGEALCRACERSHRRNKTSFMHKLIAISELQEYNSPLPNASSNCEQHPDKILEAYCSDHSKVCCMSCVMLYHRKCDKVGSIEEAATTKRNSEEFKEMEQSFIKMKADAENLVANRNENLENVREELKNIKANVEILFKEAVSHLECLRLITLEELSAAEKEIIPQIECDKEDLKCKISAIDNDLHFLQTNKERASPSHFLEAVTKLSEQKCILEQSLKKLKRSIRKVGISYTPDKTIEGLQSVIVKFGKVEISRTPVNLTATNMSKALPVLTKETSITGTPITGIACLLDGRCLVSNFKNKSLELRGSDTEFILSLPLPGHPCGVKMIDSKQGAVVIKDSDLFFFKLSGVLVQQKTAKLYFKITRDFIYHKEKFYLAGDHKITINDSSHQEMSTLPAYGEVGYIAIRDDKSLCYTVYKGYALYCITMEGVQVFKYSNVDLKGTRGVTVDNSGYIYVCGCDSKNIHQLSHGGTLLRILLDNLPRPYYLCFNARDDKVFVGCDGKILCYALQDESQIDTCA